MKISNRKEKKIRPSIYCIAQQGQEKALENIPQGQWLEFCRSQWLWMHQDRRLHFGGDILRTKSVQDKLLGTIIEGGIE